MINRTLSSFSYMYKPFRSLRECYPRYLFSSSPSAQQLKGHGRRPAPQISLESIMLQFPFQFTFQSNNYKYYDPRFTQHPIKKNLQTGQKQHILFVLQNLQGFINSGHTSFNPSAKIIPKNYSPDAIKSYFHPVLSSKLSNFVEAMKLSQLSVKMTINKDSISKSQGYMQIQQKNFGQNTPQVNFMNPKFLHQYQFQRDKQLLLVEQKKGKVKKSQQQLLQEDVKELMDQKSKRKQIRDFFNQVQKQKSSDSQRAVNFLMGKLKSLANPKTQKKKQHERYTTSQLIKGLITFQIYHKSQLIVEKQTELHTKWMYCVQSNEPESIKKSRKRILYDFQFWNRGCFFEVKDWVKELNL